MFKLLEAIGIPADHPAVGVMCLFRAGESMVEIKPGTPRHRNAVFLLAVLSMIATPIDREGVKAWMAQIVLGTKTGNMTESEIEARVDSIAFALEGKPAFLFSESLQRQVLLHDEWLPAAATIWKLVEPLFAEFEAMRYDLNRMLNRPVTAALPSPAEVKQNGWLEDPAKAQPVRLASNNPIREVG